MLARLFQAYADIFSIATFQPARPAVQKGEEEPARCSEHATNSATWPSRSAPPAVTDNPKLPRAA